MEQNKNQKVAIQDAINIIKKHQLLQKIIVSSFILVGLLFTLGSVFLFTGKFIAFIMGIVFFVLMFISLLITITTSFVDLFMINKVVALLDKILNENLQEKISEFKSNLIRYRRYNSFVFWIWIEILEHLTKEIQNIDKNKNEVEKNN